MRKRLKSAHGKKPADWWNYRLNPITMQTPIIWREEEEITIKTEKVEHLLDFLNPDLEPEKECAFCGVPTEETYCSRDCMKADILERC